jgi:CoA:oxalate CoA-transferase
MIRPIVETWLSDRTVDEAVRILLQFDVPAAPVREVDSILASDYPYERGIISPVDLGAFGTLPLVQTPILLTEACSEPIGAPPRLGADTERIIREWLHGSDVHGPDLESSREEG